MHHKTNTIKGLFSTTAVAVVLTLPTSAYASLTGFDESKLPTKYIVKFKDDHTALSSMSSSPFSTTNRTRIGVRTTQRQQSGKAR